MAALGLYHDTRSKKQTKFPLYLRVSHKQKNSYLDLGFRLEKSEWDAKRKKFKPSYPEAKRLNANISDKIALAERVIADHAASLSAMTAEAIKETIADAFKLVEQPEQVKKSEATLLKSYAGDIEETYKKANRFGMAQSIKYAASSLVNFGGENLAIRDVTVPFLLKYEADCISKGMKVNAYGAYLRAIRRIFNLAIKDNTTDVTADMYPFGRGGYSIKKAKAKKKAIKLNGIEAIRALPYKEGSALWHHRNYFLFSFNLRGMNFIDLATLKREAIHDDRIVYKRTKTKRGENVREFSIKLTEEAKTILAYYLEQNMAGSLVFPILDDVIHTKDQERIYKVYTDRLRNHNRRLAKIGRDAGLEKKLTTYVARHSFATAGLHKGVSKALIGDMLGHTNYYTTEAYFDDFDTDVLDEAADKILR